MALIPAWYSASTRAVAEKALEREVLKYPALCYIEDSNSIAYVTINNEIKYIYGTDQITDVKYVGGKLIFFNGKNILYSFDIAMSKEDADMIVQKVIESLHLEEYITNDILSTKLDNIIGNLGDKKTVIDYINSLSYNNLSDIPITNLIGNISNPVYISSLLDGVYKVAGQYIIGGSNTTVQSSANDVFFIVSKTPSTTITQLQGNSIKLFFIDLEGNCTTDKYITEQWISDQSFMTADNVKEYVRSIIETTVIEIIDKQFDERLNVALNSRFSDIPSEELGAIFTK